MLEQIAECRTAIFDKTGTLTYGAPELTERLLAPGFDPGEVLTLVASVERYSKHPLARAILAAAKKDGLELPEATEVSEARVRACAERSRATGCGSRAATGSRRWGWPAATSYRRRGTASSAWWRSTRPTRRRCGSATRRARRAVRS